MKTGNAHKSYVQTGTALGPSACVRYLTCVLSWPAISAKRP